MKKAPPLAVVTLVLITASPLWAQDWNQWRGSQRNGQAGKGPALANEWPPKGPARIWEIPNIPSSHEGGFSSVTVAGGRAYVYVDWKTHEPVPARKLTESGLRGLGWFTEKLPDPLVKDMEQARTGDELAQVKPADSNTWISQWILDHVGAKDRRTAEIVRGRLSQRAKAIPLDVLQTLAAIQDKEFATQEDLDKWYAQNNITGPLKDAVARQITTTRDVVEDVILCADAATGQELWKKEFPGHGWDWGSSSTPCVLDGRCYAVGGKTIYCLDANSGQLLWQTETQGKEVSSSPVIADGVLAVLAGTLSGYRIADGKELWTQPLLAGADASPMAWTQGGKSYFICNGDKAAGGIDSNTGLLVPPPGKPVKPEPVLGCVEAQTGKLLWTVPGGGRGTPVLCGDTAIVLTHDWHIGMAAYKLSPEEPNKLWSVVNVSLPASATEPAADPNAKPAPLRVDDRGTTPIIHDGHIYFVGGHGIWCLSLATGDLLWHEKGAPETEIASPILADGKIFAITEGGHGLIMFKASPEKFQLLGKVALNAAYATSPSIVDGRLYLKLDKSIACFDVSAK